MGGRRGLRMILCTKVQKEINAINSKAGIAREK